MLVLVCLCFFFFFGFSFSFSFSFLNLGPFFSLLSFCFSFLNLGLWDIRLSIYTESNNGKKGYKGFWVQIVKYLCILTGKNNQNFIFFIFNPKILPHILNILEHRLLSVLVVNNIGRFHIELNESCETNV